MDLDPHPMPQPVAELVAVAIGDDRVAGDGVGLGPGRSGTDRVEDADLGGAHDLVDLARLVVQLARGDGAGAVRAVATDDRPHVDEQELVLLHLSVGGVVVWQGAVLARRDDGRE